MTARLMTAKRALAQAVRMFGETAFVEYNKTALIEPELSAVRLALKSHRAQKPTDTRTRSSTDEERLAYLAVWRPWHRREQELMDAALARRCRILHVVDVGSIRFSSVNGEGDTFEEALEAAKRRA